MRADMAKVIVERPRLGGAVRKPKGYGRRLRRYGEDVEVAGGWACSVIGLLSGLTGPG